MAKVIPQKVSEAKVSYVLYPFDRATTSKEGLHSPVDFSKKERARALLKTGAANNAGLLSKSKSSMSTIHEAIDLALAREWDFLRIARDELLSRRGHISTTYTTVDGASQRRNGTHAYPLTQ